MTGGWSADGRTRRDWKQCPHVYVTDGRCFDCRAKPIESYRQVAHAGRGAVTGADMEPVITIRPGDLSHLKGDADSANRFMRGSAHIEKDAA